MQISRLKNIIFTLTMLMSGQAFAQNLVDDAVEKQALLALYNSTDGANWSFGRRWTPEEIEAFPATTLYGVEIVNGDVHSIGLDFTNLNGTLPAELNNLTELRLLSMGYNTLGGTLPDLSDLTMLTSFSFPNSDFTGNFPLWICSLTSLQSLDLSSNPNTVAKLAGPIPSQISQLSTLSLFYFNYNDLGQIGAIPDSFSSLDNLVNLAFRNCGLTPASVSLGFSGLNKLQFLDLYLNPLKDTNGAFADVLHNLPNLSTLILGAVNLQSLPSSFSSLPRLNYLDISVNNFSDSNVLSDVFSVLKNCTALQTLQLSSCSISALPANTSQLTRLQSLYLNGNPLDLSQIDPLGSIPQLITLSLVNCNMDTLPESLTSSTTLQRLSLDNNRLNPIPILLNNFPNLTTVSLNNNGITEVPNWIGTGNSVNWTDLKLNNNQIPLPFPDNFFNLTNLLILEMSHNRLEGPLPSEFSRLNQIVILELSYNKLASPLPDFSSWSRLLFIQLQHNEFTGAVPEIFSNATVIKFTVNISFNHFDALPVYYRENNRFISLITDNNKLDFNQILKVQTPIRQFVYSPQDKLPRHPSEPVSLEVFVGNAVTLKVGNIQNTQPPSLYQWFVKKPNGVVTAVSSPSTDPSVTITGFSENQVGEYFYQITNPAAPQLTLTSQSTTITVAPCQPNLVGDFSYERYVCAFVFRALSTSSSCNATTFAWDFGDGQTSTEQSPMHGFAPGTYTVTLNVTFLCGTSCQTQSTIQKQITYELSNDVLEEATVQIETERKQHILSASATTFSDTWPLSHADHSLNETNDFINGSRGVWRNEAQYVFKTDRSQSANPNLAQDGAFDLEQFNWEQSHLDAVPNWIKSNTITQYSPFSYELENRDVLGVYSAALYDYGGHLPSANGVNMRNSEMAFTSFEFLDGSVTGNLLFGNLPQSGAKTYEIKSAFDNMVVINASMDALELVTEVDVVSKTRVRVFNRTRIISTRLNHLPVVCKQRYPFNEDWTILILKDIPFEGSWSGFVNVNLTMPSAPSAPIDLAFGHSGKASLKISADLSFDQPLLALDSGKTYMLSTWVSVNNPQAITPIPLSGLGVDIVFKRKTGEVVSTISIVPSGNVIEGWQQIRGEWVCPDKDLNMELTFRPGAAGTAWFDDLRVHPKNGNMKSYVYDLVDYRLRAVLDEENFGSFYFYDKEGNLYLVKKETEDGVKTLSETVNYTIER